MFFTPVEMLKNFLIFHTHFKFLTLLLCVMCAVHNAYDFTASQPAKPISKYFFHNSIIMASSSRKRETASANSGNDAHFLSDVIRTADIDFMNIEKRTKFIKAQLDNMSDDQLTRSSKRTTQSNFYALASPLYSSLS